MNATAAMPQSTKKPQVQKEDAMWLQKEMINGNYHELAAARAQGRKVAATFVPGNLNELLMCFDFARSLPEDDLLFLRMDITDPDAVAHWVRNLEAGLTTTVVAEAGGEIAGYSALVQNRVAWQRHLGEIRTQVALRFRSQGLGRALAFEFFAANHVTGAGMFEDVDLRGFTQPVGNTGRHLDEGWNVRGGAGVMSATAGAAARSSSPASHTAPARALIPRSGG